MGTRKGKLSSDIKFFLAGLAVPKSHFSLLAELSWFIQRVIFAETYAYITL